MNELVRHLLLSPRRPGHVTSERIDSSPTVDSLAKALELRRIQAHQCFLVMQYEFVTYKAEKHLRSIDKPNRQFDNQLWWRFRYSFGKTTTQGAHASSSWC